MFLAKLFLSQTRAEILSVLFDGSAQRLHMRDLERRGSVTIGSIQKEVNKLKGLDLIKAEPDGNRLYYSANTDHPIYQELCGLVLKTSGFIEELKEALINIEGIKCAFIFGSIAHGSEKAHSDVDLIVIGDIKLRQLTPTLKQISNKIEREINPHIYSLPTFKEKMARNDHFLKSVMKNDIRYLVGGEDVFK